MTTSDVSAPQPTNAGADPEAVWLVTGCSSGFGQALAKALFAQRRRVVATARNMAALSYLPDDAGNVLKCVLDVTERTSIAQALRAAQARFGRLDVVINNAGIGVIGPLEDVSEADLRLQFEVNVFGVFNVVRAVAPIFRSQHGGMFVNFSSMAGISSIDSLGVYSASKFAVEGLSDALQAELAPYQVRVMLVEPGPFDTEWLGKNAIWSERNEARYPKVWAYVEEMKAVYANPLVVGDPARAAEAVIAAATAPNPPARLPLHEMSVNATRAKLARVAADMDRMESVALGVHYPAGASLHKAFGPLAFEPATADFVDEVGRQPPTEGLSLDQLRTLYRQSVTKNSVPSNTTVAVWDDTVASPTGSVPVRLYTPQAVADKTSGLLIYVHGGGFAVGDLESHDRLVRMIASELGHRVLALDYRRAPENPYPAAIDDVVTVYRWVLAQAGSLRVDTQRLALGGESAGGTHATAAAMAVRDHQMGPLRALWLFVPALDAKASSASYATFATGAGRTATEFAYLWSLYVPDTAQHGLPGPSPLYAPASGLPATFIYTAEFDPARDDGEAFARKIEAAGGKVTLRRQKGLVHQFPEITGLSAASRKVVVDAAHELARQF